MGFKSMNTGFQIRQRAYFQTAPSSEPLKKNQRNFLRGVNGVVQHPLGAWSLRRGPCKSNPADTRNALNRDTDIEAADGGQLGND